MEFHVKVSPFLQKGVGGGLSFYKIIIELINKNLLFRVHSLLIITSLFIFTQLALADNGLVNVKSNHSVKVTTDNLEKILKKRGMTVFARINHAQNAKKVAKELRPTELLIFGNPKIGTLLMQCSQTIAIDLPQKALIWKDKKGQVWLSYNNPKYLANRHKIKKCKKVITKIETALKNFSKAATGSTK